MNDKARPTERYDNVPIFSSLTESEIGRLLRTTDEVNAPAGTFLFKRGDPCDGFFIILSGKVEIRKPDQNGQESTIAFLSNRSVFGEMALIADRPRQASAVVIEPARLTRVRKDNFDRLLAEGDLCAYKVIHALSKIVVERLKKTEDEFLAALKELGSEKQQRKLAELQTFRQKVFTEWSF
jgi:CRP-like cAMP-binding protein